MLLSYWHCINYGICVPLCFLVDVEPFSVFNEYCSYIKIFSECFYALTFVSVFLYGLLLHKSLMDVSNGTWWFCFAACLCTCFIYLFLDILTFNLHFSFFFPKVIRCILLIYTWTILVIFTKTWIRSLNRSNMRYTFIFLNFVAGLLLVGFMILRPYSSVNVIAAWLQGFFAVSFAGYFRCALHLLLLLIFLFILFGIPVFLVAVKSFALLA